MARFMPRVYEDEDVDVDTNEELDASNEEEVNVKEEEAEEVEREEKEKVEQPTVMKRSKSKRIEEEELRPEEQG